MIFDSHFHVIDPAYPLVANQGYLPTPFTIQDYFSFTKKFNLDVKGGAVVSGSFQAFDQTYLIAALNQLGENFFGVTQLPLSVSDETIKALHKHRVRAVRFNLYRGEASSLPSFLQLENFAKRIHDLVGWHVELYIDSKDLSDVADKLLKLPKVSIDHLGLTKPGFKTLLKLAENGVKVKASGFMRVEFDVTQALKEINKANPNALMFGTDLPGTRAKRPFSTTDLQLIQSLFSEQELEKIFWKTAALFYRDASIT